MSRMVVVKSYPQGRRVWLLGQRCHHGSVGCVLLLGAFRGSLRAAALLGAALAYHDRKDARAWFKRERPPETECEHDWQSEWAGIWEWLYCPKCDSRMPDPTIYAGNDA